MGQGSAAAQHCTSGIDIQVALLCAELPAQPHAEGPALSQSGPGCRLMRRCMQSSPAFSWMQVSADRLIGLDTQPAGSLSAWLRVAKVKVDVPPGITPTMDKLSAAAQQLKQDLQRTVFLLNVCNLVSASPASLVQGQGKAT